MSDVSYIHYGIRYVGGFITDFEEDQVNAIAEFDRIRRKNPTVELVTRTVGSWKTRKYSPPPAEHHLTAVTP